MAAIHASAFSPGEQWSADALALQLGQPGAFGWIAQGGFILARCAADEAEILTLAVDPAHRRQGQARALLTVACTTARTRGAAAVLLEVAADNAPALTLYQEAGFVPAGRRPRYYPTGNDALILRLPLLGQAPERGQASALDPGN